MSWKNKVKNWDGKLYKVLQGSMSCHGGDFEWSLPKDGKPGDWTPIIEDVEMCKRGYHLTTHYAHWSSDEDVSIYEAEGDVVEFDGYNKVVCTRVRLLREVKNPFNKNNIGKNNSGIYNSGSYNSGDYNSGYSNSGYRNSGYRNSGNKNSGNYNFGNRNSGNYNSGYKNSGNFNSGYYNSGSCNIGDVNSGNYNSGDWNSGDYNSGDKNSGNWNSGYGNCGYFCRNFPPIRIFDKLVPEDWKSEFPRWMYFKLLSKGYKASWQKAFEGASIEGIKELLALPNFDYKIFEEITSITKKQIGNKIEGINLYKKLKIIEIKDWNGKLYKVLQGNKSCHGGNFEWSLPEGDKPGDWTPIIEDVKMCKRGYHLATHYAHWSDINNISIYEAEGDVIEFDGYDKVVCSRVRLLRLVENPFDKSGNNNSGKYNTGNRNSGNNNSGSFNSGDYNFGIKNSGSYNSGDRNSGDRNSGDYNSGNYNSGNWNSGNYNAGSYNSGNYNSGNWNSGNYNAGSYNSGNMNCGNWNSGDRNYGYFCKDSSPIIIFDKLAPDNWKPEFPKWIYFNLLQEGYHISWQKAFEKVDMKGIKELLALPNFDYEIFEEISSITKKQIDEKFNYNI